MKVKINGTSSDIIRISILGDASGNDLLESLECSNASAPKVLTLSLDRQIVNADGEVVTDNSASANVVGYLDFIATGLIKADVRDLIYQVYGYVVKGQLPGRNLVFKSGDQVMTDDEGLSTGTFFSCVLDLGAKDGTMLSYVNSQFDIKLSTAAATDNPNLVARPPVRPMFCRQHPTPAQPDPAADPAPTPAPDQAQD